MLRSHCRLACSLDSLAKFGALFLQAECGDWTAEDTFKADVAHLKLQELAPHAAGFLETIASEQKKIQ